MGSIEFGSIPAGVEQVRTDKDKNQVMVTGTMDAKVPIEKLTWSLRSKRSSRVRSSGFSLL